MSTVLDQLSDVTELVHRDLVRPGTKAHKERRGMSAEQVLRALIVKPISYHRLVATVRLRSGHGATDGSRTRNFCNQLR
jgi:hypothetical protein